MAVPRSLSEIPLPPLREWTAPLRPPCEPEGCGSDQAENWQKSESWRKVVHAHLTSRIPGLMESERHRLSATIVEESELAGLDPLFVLALIEVESNYDPAALSDRGAQGLMQLRPSTLRGEAVRFGLPDDDPQDPVLNVAAGVRYYQRLLRIFKRTDLALMAYNAGPNRISGYLRAGGVPERFRTYPKRVNSEFRRLRKTLAVEPWAMDSGHSATAPVE